MPNYIVTNKQCTTSQISGNSNQNTIQFFDSLSTKLLEMSEAVQKRIDDIKANCTAPQKTKGISLVSIDTPSMLLGVKVEYLVYVQRYGPPTNGVFDEKKLEQLRIELGINPEDEVI